MHCWLPHIWHCKSSWELVWILVIFVVWMTLLVPSEITWCFFFLISKSNITWCILPVYLIALCVITWCWSLWNIWNILIWVEGWTFTIFTRKGLFIPSTAMQVMHCRTVLILDCPKLVQRNGCHIWAILRGRILKTYYPTTINQTHLGRGFITWFCICHGLQLRKAFLFDKMDTSTSARKELLKLACSKLKN